MQKALQIIPSRRAIGNPGYFETLKLDRFSLIKLNGHAIFDRVEVDPRKDYETIFDNLLNKENEKLDNFFRLYAEMFQKNWVDRDCLKLFTFSWEQNPAFSFRYKEVNKTMEFALKIAKETNILVVIGYSFPFFNRETDRHLINNMKLRKVYIQDVPNRVNDIVSIFRSSFARIQNEVSITPINYVNSFFLPPEL
jgi:hypothetical protein